MSGHKFKYTTMTIIAMCLGLSSLSFAEPNQSKNVSNGYSSEEDIKNGKYTKLGPLFGRIQSEGHLPHSSTTSYYFKVGVRNYERGSLQEAEDAFEAVIRTGELILQSIYYLARINAKQGDDELVQQYVDAYHIFNRNRFASQCVARVQALDLGELSMDQLISIATHVSDSRDSNFLKKCNLDSLKEAGLIETSNVK